MTNSPCFDQTPEAVEAWLRSNVVVGTEVVIRNTQGGLLQYRLARVVRVGKGRCHVAPVLPDGKEAPSESFYFSGKNCWHPKGQTRLVIPTPATIAACEACRSGRSFLTGMPHSIELSFI